MRSEEEKIQDEVRQLGLQIVIIADPDLSQYIHDPELKRQFTRIRKNKCVECGKDYRATHWCNGVKQQVFVPNWEKLVRTLFESSTQWKRNSLKKQREEEHLRKLQQELKPRTVLEESQLKNEQLKKERLKREQSKREQFKKDQLKREQLKTEKLKREQLKKEKLQREIELAKRKNVTKSSPSSYSLDKKLNVESLSALTQKERQVFQSLQIWRNSQARKKNTTPYMIAQNSALLAIVYYKVSNVQELMRISGFTQTKAEAYGPAIIRIMDQYGMATGIKPRPPASKSPVNPPKPNPYSYQMTGKKTGNKADTDVSARNGLIFACCAVLVIITIVVSLTL